MEFIIVTVSTWVYSESSEFIAILREISNEQIGALQVDRLTGWRRLKWTSAVRRSMVDERRRRRSRRSSSDSRLVEVTKGQSCKLLQNCSTTQFLFICLLVKIIGLQTASGVPVIKSISYISFLYIIVTGIICLLTLALASWFFRYTLVLFIHTNTIVDTFK